MEKINDVLGGPCAPIIRSLNGGPLLSGTWPRLVAAVLLLSGCSALPSGDLSSVQPSVELVGSEHGRFWGVTAGSHDSRLEIRGEIIRRHSLSILRPGIVRIELIDSTGATIAEAEARPHPGLSSGPRGRRYGFITTLDVKPPEGSRLRITHIAHPRRTSEGGSSDAGQHTSMG